MYINSITRFKMSSAPGKKQMLPSFVIGKILENRRSSEYPCQLSVSIEPEGEADLQNYYVSMNLVLHENIQSEYKEWIYRTYRQVLFTYVDTHPGTEEETTEQNPFFVGAGFYNNGRSDLSFTYVSGFFGFDEEFDQKLYDLKERLDSLVNDIFDECFSDPSTALLPLGQVTAGNYKSHYKLKRRVDIEEDWSYTSWNPNLEFAFPFVLVNNKQIALAKEGGLQMRQYTNVIGKLKF